MTTDEMIALAKEKLGRDITEEEARDYLDGKLPLPDEALELVSGGASCRGSSSSSPPTRVCPRCGLNAGEMPGLQSVYECKHCQIKFRERMDSDHVIWEFLRVCPSCNQLSPYWMMRETPPVTYKCRTCGYIG
jgi:glutaredoxin-related protein